MTKEDIEAKVLVKEFASVEEVRAAYDHDGVDLQAPITDINGESKDYSWSSLLSEFFLKKIPFDVLSIR